MTLSANPDPAKTIESLAVPGLGHSIGEVASVSCKGHADGQLSVDVVLGFPGRRLYDELSDGIRAALPDATDLQINVTSKIRAHGVQRNLKPQENVKNIIAIASGKGGVGKSTTAVNLALALADDGASVGILDADIYGPSQPMKMGLTGEHPVSNDGKSMDPLTSHGVQVMSIGFLIDPDQPMVWRGPMVTSALNQLLQQTNWRNLDYLIVDMPPGTGDIQLTLSQQVPVSGAVIVTTPQDIALLDARKGLQMFRKVSVPVLGVIENMSTHVCSNCGHEEAIFGSGGGQQMSDDFDLELLGQLPLDLTIREQTDSGQPTVVSAPDSPQAEAYRLTARKMTARLALQGRDYSRLFPKIVVEDS